MSLNKLSYLLHWVIITQWHGRYLFESGVIINLQTVQQGVQLNIVPQGFKITMK